jgi:hypothetical protein
MWYFHPSETHESVLHDAASVSGPAPDENARENVGAGKPSVPSNLPPGHAMTAASHGPGSEYWLP